MIRKRLAVEAYQSFFGLMFRSLIRSLDVLKTSLLVGTTLFVLTPFASYPFVLCPSYLGTCTQLQDPPGDGGPSDCTGVPQYWVTQPNIQLRLEDEPLVSYVPGLGPRPVCHLSYRNRGAPPEDSAYFSFGPNWSCSFRAYVIDLGNGT